MKSLAKKVMTMSASVALTISLVVPAMAAMKAPVSNPSTKDKTAAMHAFTQKKPAWDAMRKTIKDAQTQLNTDRVAAFRTMNAALKKATKDKTATNTARSNYDTAMKAAEAKRDATIQAAKNAWKAAE